MLSEMPFLNTAQITARTESSLSNPLEAAGLVVLIRLRTRLSCFNVLEETVVQTNASAFQSGSNRRLLSATISEPS